MTTSSQIISHSTFHCNIAQATLNANYENSPKVDSCGFSPMHSTTLVNSKTLKTVFVQKISTFYMYFLPDDTIRLQVYITRTTNRKVNL
jgi:hypothetical protein